MSADDDTASIRLDYPFADGPVRIEWELQSVTPAAHGYAVISVRETTVSLGHSAWWRSLLRREPDVETKRESRERKFIGPRWRELPGCWAYYGWFEETLERWRARWRFNDGKRAAAMAAAEEKAT